MSNEHTLVGKTIKAIKIADDRKAILFDTDAGELIARADGGCCSSTWIEHISLPMSLPAMVLSANDIEMPDLGSPDDYECIAYYGFQIKTDRGDIVIDYRNESNGYYGGDLAWDDDHFYGGVYGQNISTMQWVPVTADI